MPRRELPLSAAEDKAPRWLVGKSLAVVELAKPAVTRSGLDAVAVTMVRKPAAATTVARKAGDLLQRAQIRGERTSWRCLPRRASARSPAGCASARDRRRSFLARWRALLTEATMV